MQVRRREVSVHVAEGDGDQPDDPATPEAHRPGEEAAHGSALPLEPAKAKVFIPAPHPLLIATLGCFTAWAYILKFLWSLL